MVGTVAASLRGLYGRSVTIRAESKLVSSYALLETVSVLEPTRTYAASSALYRSAPSGGSKRPRLAPLYNRDLDVRASPSAEPVAARLWARALHRRAWSGVARPARPARIAQARDDMRATLLRFTTFLLLLTFVPAVANAQACLTRCLQRDAAHSAMQSDRAESASPCLTESRHASTSQVGTSQTPHGSSCLFAAAPMLLEAPHDTAIATTVESWTSSPPLRPDSFTPQPPEHRPRAH